MSNPTVQCPSPVLISRLSSSMSCSMKTATKVYSCDSLSSSTSKMTKFCDAPKLRTSSRLRGASVESREARDNREAEDGRKALAKLMAKNNNSMDKALYGGSYAPVRSNKPLTTPEGFNLVTTKKYPIINEDNDNDIHINDTNKWKNEQTHVKPFEFRTLSRLRGSEHPNEDFKSLAQQVESYHLSGFRADVTGVGGPTEPKSFTFATDKRPPRNPCLSSEELELAQMNICTNGRSASCGRRRLMNKEYPPLPLKNNKKNEENINKNIENINKNVENIKKNEENNNKNIEINKENIEKINKNEKKNIKNKENIQKPPVGRKNEIKKSSSRKS
eukprot:GHVL01000393.1.p1 GENE.GHVL01000393.1~~GHVL01000393.1.p1  ORF type:complete len:332 (+),score=92.09 GHVL01000393.1:127-1122(+)